MWAGLDPGLVDSRVSGFCTALPAAPRAAPATREVAASVIAASARLTAATAAWLIPASCEATASAGLPRSMAHVAHGTGTVPVAGLVVGGGVGGVASPATERLAAWTRTPSGDRTGAPGL